MKNIRQATFLLALAAATLAGRPAHAFFHLWRFTEFFSSADGDVQFIELLSNGPNESFSQGAQIRSLSTSKVFSFPTNLAGNTSNKRLLIATAGFGSLPGGVAPDFTLPSTDFFNPEGDTITLFQGSPIDVRTFANVPQDGVTSRFYPSNTLGVNTPTNYSGASGSVNLAAPPLAGDFNGDTAVNSLDLVEWRVAFGVDDDADADGDLDSDGADYLIWQQQLGRSSAALASNRAIPEPAAALLAVAGICLLLTVCKRVPN
jgi:hypothetical protein